MTKEWEPWHTLTVIHMPKTREEWNINAHWLCEYGARPRRVLNTDTIRYTFESKGEKRRANAAATATKYIYCAQKGQNVRMKWKKLTRSSCRDIKMKINHIPEAHTHTHNVCKTEWKSIAHMKINKIANAVNNTKQYNPLRILVCVFHFGSSLTHVHGVLWFMCGSCVCACWSSHFGYISQFKRN